MNMAESGILLDIFSCPYIYRYVYVCIYMDVSVNMCIYVHECREEEGEATIRECNIPIYSKRERVGRGSS